MHIILYVADTLHVYPWQTKFTMLHNYIHLKADLTSHTHTHMVYTTIFHSLHGTGHGEPAGTMDWWHSEPSRPAWHPTMHVYPRCVTVQLYAKLLNKFTLVII